MITYNWTIAALSVMQPIGSYVLQGEDFLFDAQELESLYQDALKTDEVLTSGNQIGYIEDVAITTE